MALTDTVITVRDILRLLLQADSYPCLGNGDWRVCDLMEADALKLAVRALSSPDDPPEFGRWMKIVLKPGVSRLEREEVYCALHDFFDEADSNVSLDLEPANQPDATAWNRVGP
jgi:hypothetical protein